jgi:hypothetical protein
MLFQPNVMFAGKPRNLIYRGATWVGSGLTHKHYPWLEMFDRYKRSSLFGTLVNNEGKKFCEYVSSLSGAKLGSHSLT